MLAGSCSIQEVSKAFVPALASDACPCTNARAKADLKSVQNCTAIKIRNLYPPFTWYREENMSNPQWKWEELYLKAFLETNHLHLPARIADVEQAIGLRTTEMRTTADGELEWQAIEDAMNGLSILKREIRASMGIQAIGRLPLSNS
jgi:hypothetical protein